MHTIAGRVLSTTWNLFQALASDQSLPFLSQLPTNDYRNELVPGTLCWFFAGMFPKYSSRILPLVNRTRVIEPNCRILQLHLLCVTITLVTTQSCWMRDYPSASAPQRLLRCCPRRQRMLREQPMHRGPGPSRPPFLRPWLSLLPGPRGQQN